MDAQFLSQYEALLFDLDGTLAHSMPLHNEAWIECLREFGYLITHSILQEYAGVPTLRTVEIFNLRYAWKLDPGLVAERKESLFLQKLSLIQPIHPVVQIAKSNSNHKLAIVSGGTRNLVAQILQSIRLDQHFPIRVCAEDVANGKPSPDPFLKAAALLGIAPEKCLVFEDGEAGIQAAKAAGMDVVRVESDFRLTLQR